MIICFVLAIIAMGALPFSSSGQRSEYEGDTYLPEEPRDGFVEEPDGSKPEHLLHVSAKGELLSVWQLPGGGADGIIPCTTDTSVFINYYGEIKRYHPGEPQPVVAGENEYSGEYYPILAYLPNYKITPLDLNPEPDGIWEPVEEWLFEDQIPGLPLP